MNYCNYLFLRIIIRKRKRKREAQERDSQLALLTEDQRDEWRQQRYLKGINSKNYEW